MFQSKRLDVFYRTNCQSERREENVKKTVFRKIKGIKFCRFKNNTYLCIAFEKERSQRSFGEVAEWSIAAVLKTVVPRGTRGSNPCLSARA